MGITQYFAERKQRRIEAERKVTVAREAEDEARREYLNNLKKSVTLVQQDYLSANKDGIAPEGLELISEVNASDRSCSVDEATQYAGILLRERALELGAQYVFGISQSTTPTREFPGWSQCEFAVYTVTLRGDAFKDKAITEK